MGTPDFAVPCVEALSAHPACELALVVCQPDKRHGRHKTPQPPPVKVAALAAGVPVAQPRRLKRGAFPERLEALRPDLVVVTAYGRILPPRILAAPRLGCVNAHASLLPRWRGAAPIQWSIVSGDPETGVCLMQMDEGLDTGPVLARETTPIRPDDTGKTVHDRLSALGGAMLVRHLEAILAGRVARTAQPTEGATYARMLTREDGRIDWSKPARAVADHLRGFYPWPGAFTTAGGAVLKLFPFAEVVDEATGAPGTVLEAHRGGLLVGCGAGAIRVRELQLQGRKRMPIDAFLLGQASRVAVGSVLG